MRPKRLLLFMIVLTLLLILAASFILAANNSCGHSSETLLRVSNAEFSRLLAGRIEQTEIAQAIEPTDQGLSLTVFPLRLIRTYRYDYLGYDAEIYVGPCLEIIDYYIVRR